MKTFIARIVVICISSYQLHAQVSFTLSSSPGVGINGTLGYPYIIERTANLADPNSWVTVTNIILTQPMQVWVDTGVDASSPFNSIYFYRVSPGSIKSGP